VGKGVRGQEAKGATILLCVYPIATIQSNVLSGYIGYIIVGLSCF